VFGDRDSGAYPSGSSGRRSSAIRCSGARRHPMTLPWPSTGRMGGRGPPPIGAGSPWPCSESQNLAESGGSLRPVLAVLPRSRVPAQPRGPLQGPTRPWPI